MPIRCLQSHHAMMAYMDDRHFNVNIERKLYSFILLADSILISMDVDMLAENDLRFTFVCSFVYISY